MLLSFKQKYIYPLIVSDKELVQACRTGNLPLLRNYINEHNVNGIDKDGTHIPLVLACWENQVDVVKFLLTFPNLDINKIGKDLNPTTASHTSLLSLGPVMPALFASICVAKSKDKNKSDVAVEIIQLLVSDDRTKFEYEYNLHNNSSLGLACNLDLYYVVKLLLPYTDPNTAKYNNEQVIIHAYNRRNYHIVELILSSPKFDLASNYNYYAGKYFADIVVDDCNYDLLQVMISQPHIDINGFHFRGTMGSKPSESFLHQACIKGLTKMVDMCFSRHDLDVNLVDDMDRQAIYYATNHSSVLCMLLSRPDLQVRNPHECIVRAVDRRNYITLLLLIADDRFSLVEDISYMVPWERESHINKLVTAFWTNPEATRQNAKQQLKLSYPTLYSSLPSSLPPIRPSTLINN